MIEFEEYKGKLHDLHPKLDDLGQSLNIEGAKNELERYHAMQEAPGFWDDRRNPRRLSANAASWRQNVSAMKKCAPRGTT